MNNNIDFDLKKAKSRLLTEMYGGYDDQYPLASYTSGGSNRKQEPKTTQEPEKKSFLQKAKEKLGFNENEEYRMGIFDDIDADLMNEEDRIGYLKAIIDYCNQEINSIDSDESVSLEEMASIPQVTKALQNRNSPTDQETKDVIEKAYQATLKQFDPETATIVSDRLKGFASAFKKNLPSKGYFEKIAAELDLPNSDLAVNTTEKTAANDLLGKTPNKKGPKVDLNKPAAAPKAKKSSTIKITAPKAAAKTTAPTSKLADLAPKSVFGGGEESEEEMEMDKQATKGAKSTDAELGSELGKVSGIQAAKDFLKRNIDKTLSITKKSNSGQELTSNEQKYLDKTKKLTVLINKDKSSFTSSNVLGGEDL